MNSIPLWRYIAVGVAGGTLSGLAGVGGGVVIVPLITAYLALSQRQAHAVSLGAIVPTAIASALVYALWPRDEPPGNAVPAYIAGAGFMLSAVLAAPLGVRISHRINQRQLKRLFAILLTAVGLRMLLQHPVLGNAILIAGFVLMVAVGIWSLVFRREETQEKPDDAADKDTEDGTEEAAE